MDDMNDIGIRMTPQRIAVLEFLKGNKEHPSADDIYKKVKERYPTISVATVYNTLEALKRTGKVIELKIDPSRKRYDPDTRQHHHMICQKCKRISDIHIDIPIDLPDDQIDDFDIMNNHVEFYGLCKKCKNS
jgi:Fur family peroxide stress response transcriptional regulator